MDGGSWWATGPWALKSDMTERLSHLTYKIAILHLHIYQKKLNHIYKAIYTQMFIASLFIADKFVRLLDYLKS